MEASTNPNADYSGDTLQVYAAIGRAITRWQSVEAGLCNIFERVSGCQHPISSAVFYSMQAFNQKLATTDAVARQALDDDQFLKVWRPVHSQMSDASQQRNALAHFVTVQKMAMDGTILQTVLMPNIGNPNKPIVKKDGELNEIDLAKIVTIAQTFDQVQAAARQALTAL